MIYIYKKESGHKYEHFTNFFKGFQHVENYKYIKVCKNLQKYAKICCRKRIQLYTNP